MSAWWQLLVGLICLWLVVRFVRRMFRPREPSESVEGPLAGDPLAGVPAREKPDPQNRSGAVALAEPDEEDDNRSYPPRKL